MSAILDLPEARRQVVRLSVEKIAVSNEALDRENAALYPEAGVKEYWIVLGARQQVEAYRFPVVTASFLPRGS
jgi:hypothetical protein